MDICSEGGIFLIHIQPFIYNAFIFKWFLTGRELLIFKGDPCGIFFLSVAEVAFWNCEVDMVSHLCSMMGVNAVP